MRVIHIGIEAKEGLVHKVCDHIVRVECGLFVCLFHCVAAISCLLLFKTKTQPPPPPQETQCLLLLLH